ncbi:MAG: phosphotransferase enzyme family protein [Desertimonas sp.]
MSDVDRPFVATPAGPPAVTGPLAAAAAEHWGLAEPVLLRTGMNAVYVSGDVLLRVAATSAPAEASLALARLLDQAGVAVPLPRRDDVVSDGDRSVTAWQRIEAIDAPVDWRAVGTMVRRVHGLPDDTFPPDYPRPPASAFPWWDFDTLLAEVGGDLDPAARSGIEDAIVAHGWWRDAPDRPVTCHGDVHPGNVVVTAEGPMLLDWDLLCRAPRGWDHSMLLRAGRWEYCEAWYEDFAAGYRWHGGDDPLTTAIAELRLVAATLMRARAARIDPAARPELERRLAYWRGDADAPRWRPV